jgi:hypothetical protein
VNTTQKVARALAQADGWLFPDDLDFEPDHENPRVRHWFKMACVAVETVRANEGRE